MTFPRIRIILRNNLSSRESCLKAGKSFIEEHGYPCPVNSIYHSMMQTVSLNPIPVSFSSRISTNNFMFFLLTRLVLTWLLHPSQKNPEDISYPLYFMTLSIAYWLSPTVYCSFIFRKFCQHLGFSLYPILLRHQLISLYVWDNGDKGTFFGHNVLKSRLFLSSALW